MSNSKSANRRDEPATAGIGTSAFAQRNLVRPQSVVARLCRTGSYHGIRPTKLASGRLLWPAITVTADPAKAA